MWRTEGFRSAGLVECRAVRRGGWVVWVRMYGGSCGKDSSETFHVEGAVHVLVSSASPSPHFEASVRKLIVLSIPM
jgi:hypothetical protein